MGVAGGPNRWGSFHPSRTPFSGGAGLNRSTLFCRLAIFKRILLCLHGVFLRLHLSYFRTGGAMKADNLHANARRRVNF